MKSPPHRANIFKSEIDGDRNRHRTAGERYFWRAGFFHRVGALTKEEQEKKVGELLHARGLRIAEHQTMRAKRAIFGGNCRCDAMAILHFEPRPE